MPIMREFTIQMEDRPGILGQICRMLADRGVNILCGTQKFYPAPI